MSDEIRALLAQRAAEKPYRLEYRRVGGHRTGVGLVLGSRPAKSVEDAERQRRLMEREDEAHGHETTYTILHPSFCPRA